MITTTQTFRGAIGSQGDFWSFPATLSVDTHMTALAAILTAQGFLIGADGRKWKEEESLIVDDFSQKVFPILEPDKTLAYGVTGFVLIDDIDVLELLQKKTAFLSRRQFPSCRKYLDALCSQIANELEDARKTGKIAIFPQGRKAQLEPSAWTIFSIVLVGFFKNIPAYFYMEFFRRDEVHVEYAINTHNGLLLFGSDVVRRALYPNPGEASDPRFAGYADEDLATLNDLERGAACISGYIAACSCELAKELDPEMTKIIGGHMHIAEITNTGFRWRIAPQLGKSDQSQAHESH